MKQLMLFSVSALCMIGSVLANDRVENQKDTVQLKQRIEFLEKQVASLDSHVKVLREKLALSQPTSSTPKKMVIDRRGSKQVRYE